MKYVFAGYLLFPQFGHYFDMEMGMRMSSCAVWQPLPTEPSSRARPLQDHAFARLALPPQPHRGKEAYNQPPLPHRLRGGTPPQLQQQLPQPPRCETSWQAPARQPEDALLRKLFLQLLTPPTEDTNGGPTG